MTIVRVDSSAQQRLVHDHKLLLELLKVAREYRDCQQEEVSDKLVALSAAIEACKNIEEK